MTGLRVSYVECLYGWCIPCAVFVSIAYCALSVKSPDTI